MRLREQLHDRFVESTRLDGTPISFHFCPQVIEMAGRWRKA
jgi:hypothetical protein